MLSAGHVAGARRVGVDARGDRRSHRRRWRSHPSACVRARYPRLVGPHARVRSRGLVAVPASPERCEEAIPVQGDRRAVDGARRAADRGPGRACRTRRAAGWPPTVGTSAPERRPMPPGHRNRLPPSSRDGGTTIGFPIPRIVRRRSSTISSGSNTPAFAVVDCCWLYAGHAVYGGFKAGGEPAAGGGIAFDRALATVRARLS